MAKDIVVKPPRGPVTAAWLTRLTVPEGVDRMTVKDDQERGLELRLTAKGARSWAVSRRDAGRQRRYTLPGGATMTLGEARRAARALKAELDRGRDPIAERRKARAEAAEARRGGTRPATLRGLLDAFEQAVAHPKGQRSWTARRGHLEAEYRAHLDRPLATITAATVREVLDAAARRAAPVSGWRGYAYLKRVLTWAERRGYVAANAAAAVPLEEVADVVRREGRRDHVLLPAEIGRLWRALELAEATEPYAAMLRLMLLTAQRRGEIAGMRWADLDLERREWRQPTNKSDRPHTVPLSSAALAIIEAQPRRKDYVFLSSGAGNLEGRKGNWNRATAKYSEASGVIGWTRHDLRRTAATLLASLKVDRGIIEMLLNHAESAGKGGMVASIYNRHSYEIEKREAVERLARHIRELADNGTGAVVDLPISAVN